MGTGRVRGLEVHTKICTTEDHLGGEFSYTKVMQEI